VSSSELESLQREALEIARVMSRPGSAGRLMLLVTRAYVTGRRDERDLLKGLILTALAEPALSDDDGEPAADAAGRRASLAEQPGMTTARPGSNEAAMAYAIRRNRLRNPRGDRPAR
jgi:hypothetical protein